MADKVRGHERLRCFLYLFPRFCFLVSWLLLVSLLLLLGKNCNCATLGVGGSVQSRIHVYRSPF